MIKFCFVLMALVMISCGNKNNAKIISLKSDVLDSIAGDDIHPDSIRGAFLKLDKIKYDFGKVSRKKTPNIVIDFEIENIGKNPLVIIKGDVSCGCLSVKYPKYPIKVGEKAQLTVSVDTKNQQGAFNKPVFIKTNADNDVVLIRIIG